MGTYDLNCTFEEFCVRYQDIYMNNHHTLPQVHYTGGNEIDLLIPLEKLQQMWPLVHERYPTYINPQVGEHTHASKRGSWESYYTPELKKTMLNLLQDDLALYEEACGN